MGKIGGNKIKYYLNFNDDSIFSSVSSVEVRRKEIQSVIRGR